MPSRDFLRIFLIAQNLDDYPSWKIKTYGSVGFNAPNIGLSAGIDKTFSKEIKQSFYQFNTGLLNDMFVRDGSTEVKLILQCDKLTGYQLDGRALLRSSRFFR